MSLAPSFWCAWKSGVRLSMIRGQWSVDGGQWLMNENRSTVEFARGQQQPEAWLPPFFRLQLFLRHLEIDQHEVFSELDQFVWPARVKHRVRQIVDVFLDPLGRDASAPAGPGILRVQPRAGDIEVKVGVVQLQLVELVVENDVVRRAHAVQDRNLRLQFASGGFAREGAKRCHPGTARDADQVLVRLVNWQESPGRRNDEHPVAWLRPIDNARAHLAVAFDSDLVKTAVERR